MAEYGAFFQIRITRGRSRQLDSKRIHDIQSTGMVRFMII
jgi:hypothetical protein